MSPGRIVELDLSHSVPRLVKGCLHPSDNFYLVKAVLRAFCCGLQARAKVPSRNADDQMRGDLRRSRDRRADQVRSDLQVGILHAMRIIADGRGMRS
jgi:hypothetical protein